MRTLGIDHGQVRVGLALSDPLGMIASPLKTVERRRKRKQDIADLAALVQELDVAEVVIGIPFEMTGAMGKKAKEVLQFAQALREVLDVPVIEWDERLTTVQAERSLTAMDVRGSRRKQLVDQMAAAIILQGYLDSKPRSEEEPW